MTIPTELEILKERYRNIKEYSELFLEDNAQNKSESEHLRKILHVIDTKITHLEEKLKRHIADYEQIRKQKSETGKFSSESDDPDDPFDDHWMLNRTNQGIIVDIKNSLKHFEDNILSFSKPYFGSIKTKTNGKLETTYLGRKTVINQTNKTVEVADWRAPISSIYYMNSGPKESLVWDKNGVKEKSDLIEKTSYEVKSGRLIDVYKSTVGNKIADEFLSSQLLKKQSGKLTDIISTIQNEQNEIIREGKNKSVIIQGVAGSGKTTILFHKLAYLLFTFPKDFNPQNCLFIAPNRSFKDYVSDIVIELGLGGLNVSTYYSFVRTYLNLDNIFILSQNDNSKYIPQISDLKEIDQLFNNFMLTAFELKQIPEKLRKKIKENYEIGLKKNSSLPIWEIIETSVDYALSSFLSEKYAGIVGEDYEKTFDSYSTEIYKQLKIKLNPVSLLISFANLKPTSSLLMFLSNSSIKDCEKWYEDYLTSKEEKKTQENKQKLFLRRYEYPILLYLFGRINGYKRYDFIAIDEVQNFSPFELFVIKNCVRNDNVIVAGDIAQSLEKTELWKELKDIKGVISKENYSFHELTRSYRTTSEILQYIKNRLTESFPPNYIFPSSDISRNIPVEVSHVNSMEDFVKMIRNDLTEDNDNISIICNDIKTARKLARDISKADEQLGEMITRKYNSFTSGLFMLTPEKAKGLEFDSVYMYGFKELESNNEAGYYEARRLYVAMTRAIKKLVIINS